MGVESSDGTGVGGGGQRPRAQASALSGRLREFVAPPLDAGAAKAAQNCPQPRFDGLQAPETVQNWAVPRFSAALRLVDAGCSHDVDVHQDAQLHGPWDARKTAEKLPPAARAAQDPSESP